MRCLVFQKHFAIKCLNRPIKYEEFCSSTFLHDKEYQRMR